MANYHSWLQQVVVPYFDPGRVFRDVDVTLMSFQSLRPKTDNFQRQGSPQLLICLFGPLACGVHNIPFEIWIPRNYPREGPLMYVNPSPGISVRPTNLVDGSGRVLLGWRMEGGLIDYVRAVMNNLAMDPPFHPGAGRPNPALPPSHSPLFPPPNHQRPLMPSPPFPVPHQMSPPPPPTSSAKPQINTTPAIPVAAGLSSESTPQLKFRLEAKVKERFDRFQNDLSMDTENLLSQNTQLCQNEEKLRLILSKLMDEVEKAENQIQIIIKQKEFAAELVHRPSTDEIDINTLVSYPGAVACQIASLIGQDLAYQDFFFSIAKVFNDRKVPSFDLITYLKLVRDSAHEQFMVRALLAKIRKKYPILN